VETVRIKHPVIRFLGWLLFGGALALGVATAIVSVGECQSEIRFTQSSTEPGRYNAGSIATGDFNGDGKPDFVGVADWWDFNWPTTWVWSIAVGLGVGDGTFLSVSNYVISPVAGENFAYVAHIATADINRDGLTDVLATYGLGWGHGNVAVFTARSDGSLVRMADVVPERSCGWIDVADFNGDGNLDFVVNASLTNELTIYFGDGQGAFPVSTKVGIPASANCLAAADINVDGRPDLLAGYYGIASTPVVVLVNQLDGTFTTVTNIPLGFAYHVDSSPSAITVADFNADGWPDFACGSLDGPELGIVIQRAGIFTVFTNYVLSREVSQCVAADFNGDGITDLATEANLLVGKGNGEFIPSRPAEDDEMRGSLAVADVNRDGRPDILGSAGWFNCATNHTRPSLRMERAGNQARISWPAWKGFTFQTANSLHGEFGWTVVNDGVKKSNGRNVVVLPAESPAKFFRLEGD